MQTDSYVKAILTVIAFCLLIIVLQNAGLFGARKVELYLKGRPVGDSVLSGLSNTLSVTVEK